jgi:hypothetical protein
MPQNPVLVYSTEDGTPSYMHTVDASEAIRLGDYTPTAPGEVPPEARASAMSRFKTGQAVTHPELQTDEEKQAARQKANEEAELLAGLPPGTPIVVQAPSDRPAQREARQAAQRAQVSSAHTAVAGAQPAPTPATTSSGGGPAPAEHHEAEPGGTTRPRRP